MADMAARQRHIGETRLVECKQKAREGLAAHHEHVGAKSETGEATVTRVDVHSGHIGANFSDGGAQATVMDKMGNQPVIEHLGNKVELEVH
jgi:hypothetical protein